MQNKNEIVRNWLPRYTGMALENFGKHIILVNFTRYVELFAARHGTPIQGQGKAMQACTSRDGDITLVQFGMGSPQAATIVDLLTAIEPKSALFLGKCGSLRRKIRVGDYLLPFGAIRGEGTSNDYLPAEVPAIPSLGMQKAIGQTLSQRHRDYYTGVIYTTNRRVWEHDARFKEYLSSIRAIGIDMETATLCSVAFKNKIPLGVLLLVSDQPMTPEGVKTAESDIKVDEAHLLEHLKIGVDSIKKIINGAESIRHLIF